MMSAAIRPYLMDLGSTNGSFLNGERLEAQRYYELYEKVSSSLELSHGGTVNLDISTALDVFSKLQHPLACSTHWMRMCWLWPCFM